MSETELWNARQRAQSIMRLIVMGVIWCWIVACHLLGWLTPEAWARMIKLYSVMIPLAVVFLALTYLRPSTGWPRRIAGMALDYGTLTWAIGIGGEAMAPTAAAIAWITAGYGLRHNMQTLIFGSVVAFSCLGLVFVFNDFWRASPLAMLALALVTLLVPTYVLVMLRRLELAFEAAQQANRSKSQFLAQASHDLRQPIHAITLFTSSLREAGLQGRELAMVENIDRSLESVSRLFKSLLDVSTLDSGRVAPTLEAVDLQEVIDELLVQNSAEAERAGVGLRNAATSLWVETDRGLLTTVLQNIVNNAIKYAPGSEVLVGCRRQNGRVAVEILDRGPGIARHHVPHLFNEFYQVRERGSRDVEGVGLGLPIVRRMADLLGLEVDLATVEGRGTRVVISGLKVCRPRAKREAKHNADARPASVMDGLRVLLIEDDQAVLLATAELLRSWGCEVDAVTNCPTSAAEYDLMITDFDLGAGVTGKDCIDAVRAQHGWQLPAVVMSGHDPERVREQLADPGVALLSKPVRPAELRSVVLASAVTAE